MTSREWMYRTRAHMAHDTWRMDGMVHVIWHTSSNMRWPPSHLLDAYICLQLLILYMQIGLEDMTCLHCIELHTSTEREDELTPVWRGDATTHKDMHSHECQTQTEYTHATCITIASALIHPLPVPHLDASLVPLAPFPAPPPYYSPPSLLHTCPLHDTSCHVQRVDVVPYDSENSDVRMGCRGCRGGWREFRHEMER